MLVYHDRIQYPMSTLYAARLLDLLLGDKTQRRAPFLASGTQDMRSLYRAGAHTLYAL